MPGRLVDHRTVFECLQRMNSTKVPTFTPQLPVKVEFQNTGAGIFKGNRRDVNTSCFVYTAGGLFASWRHVIVLFIAVSVPSEDVQQTQWSRSICRFCCTYFTYYVALLASFIPTSQTNC